MREHLLGYVLGALDASEQADLEARLAADPQLRRELEEVRATLAPLDADDTDPTPPQGMAERTCRFVCSYAGWTPWAAASQSETLHAGGSWRAQDVMVAAGIFVAASMLIFPAVSSSVSGSRRLQCQNNLRQLGMALVHYSDQFGHCFPDVPPEGRFGVAGMYAARLYGGGYLQKPSQVLCPETATEEHRNFTMPSDDEIIRADRVRLRIIQVNIGGTYCYSPGYYDANGTFRGTRNHNRTFFVILADKPGNLAGGGNPNHDKGGQNVLFENGRVEFQLGSRVYEIGDDIYTSDFGIGGAGRGPDDAVVCPSDTPPVHPIYLHIP